ncbi:MAG: Nitrogen regulation protein NtrC [Ignavibacteriae bacterium]|nr:MAG: Nitrogen regulation protein NtrC [Ignavibacteriota bacterium]
MKNISVLFVDDDDELRRAITDGLKENGFNVIPAESGPVALNILKTFKPDIIITDLRMEPMNGFDFYQIVKKNSEFENIPFIFLTAINDFLAEKYSKELGVNSYVTKPIDVDKLALIIKSNLNL